MSRTDQLVLCLITLMIIPGSTLPLELQRRITNEAIGGNDLNMLLQGGTIVAVLGYLIWMQPLIASLAILLHLPELVLVPLGQRILNKLSATHVRLVRALGDSVVRETDPASFGARRFPHLAWRALVVRMASYRIKYILTFLGNFLDAAGPLGVLVVGGWLVLQGRTTLGTLVVFITGFQKVGDPTDQLMTFYRTAQNAWVRYDLLMVAVSSRLGKDPPARGDGTVAA